MRKLLNKPWFVALLGVIALGAVWHTLAPFFSHPRPIAEPLATATTPVPEEEAVAAAPAEETKVPAVAELLRQVPPGKVARDPFAPTATTNSTQNTSLATPAEPDVVETVHLSALWNQQGVALAVLNDEVRRAGDTIGRVKIDSIGPRGVWLSHPKGQSFLEVGKNFVLRTPGRLAAKSPSLSTP